MNRKQRAFSMRLHRRRRGVVLAAALACVFIMVLLSAALASSALHRQRQLKLQERQLQADLLAQSAARLAAARLRADAEYMGETWTAAATDLESRYAGRAVISVVAAENQRRAVTIEVLYPDDPLDRTRIEKTFLVASPESDSSEP
jgi:type II secretory pathway component PulK